MGIAGVGGLGGGGGGVPAGNKGGLAGGDLVARIEKMGELWALLVHTRVRVGGDSVPPKAKLELHKEFACEGLARGHTNETSVGGHRQRANGCGARCSGSRRPVRRHCRTTSVTPT